MGARTRMVRALDGDASELCKDPRGLRLWHISHPLSGHGLMLSPWAKVAPAL